MSASDHARVARRRIFQRVPALGLLPQTAYSLAELEIEEAVEEAIEGYLEEIARLGPRRPFRRLRRPDIDQRRARGEPADEEE